MTGRVSDDQSRLETSLAAVRRNLSDLDSEILETLDPIIRRRKHLVSVVWQVKEALGLDLVEADLEREIDEAREAAGIPQERVAVLRAIREASRPR